MKHDSITRMMAGRRGGPDGAFRFPRRARNDSVAMPDRSRRGFTLIELLVTMALVIIVIMITASAFESILKNTSRLTASEESNIEGVVGLEMFRHDLMQMGYGLPHAYQSIPPNYTEAAVAPASGLNDSGTLSRVPRAVVSLESVTGATDLTSEGAGSTYSILNGSDYIAIKGMTVGSSNASKKWTYVGYSAGAKKPNQWPNAADNLKSTDRVIVLDRSFTATGQVVNTMQYDIGTPSTYWPSNPTVNMNDVFNPGNSKQTYYLYGVDDGSLGMPFNRADYFVARPSNTAKISSACAPNTGILYKATVNHADGKLRYMPLLDCVADMQVVFGWDVAGSGTAIDESSAYSSDVSKIQVSSSVGTLPSVIQSFMLSPDDIRTKLKYVKIYIMAQEGRKDPNYVNTAAVDLGDPGNTSLTKSYSVAALTANSWLNYRWKVYRIVARPKNF